MEVGPNSKQNLMLRDLADAMTTVNMSFMYDDDEEDEPKDVTPKQLLIGDGDEIV